MGALALGTDTGGSVRLPAAGCEVVGLKTPFGAIATDGVFPLAPDLDTVGPMARTVEDCALAWSVLSGEPVPEPSLEGKRIGKLVRLPEPGRGGGRAARSADRRAPRRAGRAAGARGRRVAGVLRRRRGVAPRAVSRSARREYGPVISAKLDRALATTPEAYAHARAAMAAWQRAAATDPPVDVIVSPVLGLPELPAAGTPEQEFRIPFSAYARTFNFLGWPAIAIGRPATGGARHAHTARGISRLAAL